MRAPPFPQVPPPVQMHHPPWRPESVVPEYDERPNWATAGSASARNAFSVAPNGQRL